MKCEPARCRDDAEPILKGRHCRRDKKAKDLRFLWLEITPGCNLRCGHCYSESLCLRAIPRSSTGIGVLPTRAKSVAESVQFIGGEPLYHRDLVEYVATAHELTNFIEVYTNLTLVSVKLLEQFSRYGVHVATSFYSTRKVRLLLNSRRGVRGSFEKTLRGIRSVVEKRIPLRVGITSMGASAKDEKKCISFLVKMGVDQSAKLRWIIPDPLAGAVNSPWKLQSLEETLCGGTAGKESWLCQLWTETAIRVFLQGSRRLAMTRSSSNILRSVQLKQSQSRIFDYQRPWREVFPAGICSVSFPRFCRISSNRLAIVPAHTDVTADGQKFLHLDQVSSIDCMIRSPAVARAPPK